MKKTQKKIIEVVSDDKKIKSNKTKGNIWQGITFLLIVLILALSVMIAYNIGNQNGYSDALDFLSKTRVVGIGKLN